MDSSSVGPSKSEVQQLIRNIQVPTLQKTALQTICQVNGLQKSGNKKDLQSRIIERINRAAAENNVQEFNEIRASLYQFSSMKRSSQPQAPYPGAPAAYKPAPSPYNMPLNYGGPNGHGLGNASRPSNVATQSFQFKVSPFFELKHRIGEVKVLEAMPQHKTTLRVPVKAQDHQILQQVGTDPDLKVMVLCAGSNGGQQDIAFPSQSELRVNTVDVKANLRGLKNKPGSTRPADITSLLRLRPVSYENGVEFTYALTNKKYYYGVYVCKTTPVPVLAEQIRKTRKIPIDVVLSEMSRKAQDPDIVATSQNVSLKCPISFRRPEIPCRGTGCSHLGCFDAATYLELQTQAPQWVCPICEKSAPFNQLAVDEYMLEILQKTHADLEQVTIDPDGKWKVPGQAQNTRSEPREDSYILDEDLDIPEPSYAGNRAVMTPTPNRSIASFGTPQTGASRGSSAIPQQVAGTKRPAEVIDLTLSDDEDDAPLPPPKRTNYGGSWAMNGQY